MISSSRPVANEAHKPEHVYYQSAPKRYFVDDRRVIHVRLITKADMGKGVWHVLRTVHGFDLVTQMMVHPGYEEHTIKKLKKHRLLREDGKYRIVSRLPRFGKVNEGEQSPIMVIIQESDINLCPLLKPGRHKLDSFFHLNDDARAGWVWFADEKRRDSFLDQCGGRYELHQIVHLDDQVVWKLYH